MIRVFIKKDQTYSKPIEYILSVFAKHKSCLLSFETDKAMAQLIFDHSDPNSLAINTEFYESLLYKKIFRHDAYFKKEPYLLFPNSNKQDWLGTAFYLINSFQEYNIEPQNESLDKFGRFRYEKSYQNKFNCIEENVVQKCFDGFAREHEVCSDLSKVSRKTKVFISHDVDTLNGSFLQDGLWAIKRGRLDIILKLVMNEILLNPGWKNMDKITKLHSEHDLKSTFFWLATKKVAENRIKNADYSVAKLDHLIKKSTSHGLHKSCYNFSFEEELNMLPFDTKLNRFHFLKFNLPDSWVAIQKSALQLDASLGYAERYGYRNSYGLPFRPYNISTQTSYDFVEVPLNIMDGALHRYMKIPLKETGSNIIDFFEKNKTNCIISLLWHNTYFTSYKYSGYLQEYKKVLFYLNESGIKSITPEEIIKEFAND